MEKALISVIIPVYNAEKRLAVAIESVRNQTYKNIQLLLINDGSTDQSAQICDNYANLDKRVQVVHQQNQGVSAARNRGLDEARGDFITFVDGDDEIDPLAFQTSMEMFAKDSIDMVVLGMFFDYYDGQTLQKSHRRFIDKEACFEIKDIKSYFFDLIHENYFTPIWNKLIRARIIKENHLYFDVEMAILEDFKFVLDVLEKSRKICALPQAYYHYYHDLNSSQMKRRPRIDYFRNFQILDQKLRAFSQRFELDLASNEARINGMIFRFYLIAVEKLYSGVGSFKDKQKDMKSLLSREELRLAGEKAEVNGFRLRLVLFLFKKKCVRTLATLFFINDWINQIKGS